MTTQPVHPSRKPGQPYDAHVHQDWASNVLEAQHEEALYAYGELALFTMMWRPADFEAGLVGRCTVCFGGATSRQAAAFQQPAQRECPSCYGTTYEGGFRAQIIRPALMADRNSEVTDQARGVVVTDTIAFETTADFTLHKGDYVFRFDNSRFQVEEKSEAVVRPGFGPPLSPDSFAGASTAHKEETTSVAYRILPTDPMTLATMLSYRGPLRVGDLSVNDVIRTRGYI